MAAPNSQVRPIPKCQRYDYFLVQLVEKSCGSSPWGHEQAYDLCHLRAKEKPYNSSDINKSYDIQSSLS